MTWGPSCYDYFTRIDPDNDMRPWNEPLSKINLSAIFEICIDILMGALALHEMKMADVFLPRGLQLIQCFSNISQHRHWLMVVFIWLFFHFFSILNRSPNGQYLIVSSTDGYVSMVTFEEGELGTPYKPEIQIETEEKLQKSCEPDPNISDTLVKPVEPQDDDIDKVLCYTLAGNWSGVFLVVILYLPSKGLQTTIAKGIHSHD